MELKMGRAAQLNMALVVAFLGVRFLLTRQLNSLGMYASYVFEAAFVAFCLVLHRKKFRFLPDKLTLPLLAQLMAAPLLGALAYHASKRLNIIVPFDITQTETVIFLLLISPVLEELLFRQALWHALAASLKKPRQVLIGTAVLFSYANFHAYFFMPEPLKPFVLYQTLYTFVLGLWWGWAFQRTCQAFLVPLALHFAFNLGFYIGFRALGIV